MVKYNPILRPPRAPDSGVRLTGAKADIGKRVWEFRFRQEADCSRLGARWDGQLAVRQCTPYRAA